MSKFLDKLGVSSRARAEKAAPEDSTLDELVHLLSVAAKGLTDLGTRVTLFNGTAQKLFGDAEKLAVQAATLFGPVGVGRNGDFAAVKDAKKAHDQRLLVLQESSKVRIGMAMGGG